MALAVGSTKFGTASSGLQIGRHTGNFALSGTEDLGGGLRAGFRLETSIGSIATTNAGVAPTTLGDRGAAITVSGGFGSVLVGRAPTSVRALWGAIGDMTRLQPLTTMSAGANGQSNSLTPGSATDQNARIIYGDAYANQVSWTSPAINGFTVGVGVVPVQSGTTGVGNDAANKDTYSASVMYSQGPIAAAFNIVDAKGTSTAINVPYKQQTLFASYDFGVARVGLTYQTIDLSTGVDPGAGTAITAAIPLGAGNIGLGYGKRSASASTGGSATGFGDDAKQTQIGYRHDLSKRTSIQVVWNKLDRAGTAFDIKEQHIVLFHSF